jgi:hypothetical protein
MADHGGFGHHLVGITKDDAQQFALQGIRHLRKRSIVGVEADVFSRDHAATANTSRSRDLPIHRFLYRSGFNAPAAAFSGAGYLQMLVHAVGESA